MSQLQTRPLKLPLSLRKDPRSGIGVTADMCRAKELNEKSCATDENPVGCANLGDMLVRGDCGERDYVKGRALLEKTCTEQHKGCSSIGAMYQDGKGVEKSPETAREYFVKGCNNQESTACNRLGLALQNGVGGPVDRAAALNAFDRACLAGRPESCASAAKMAGTSDSR